MLLELTAAGSVDDYDAEEVERLRAAVALAAGVPIDAVTLTIEPGSVVISVVIDPKAATDPTTASEVELEVEHHLGTAAAASAALGIDVEVTPIFVSPPPPSPSHPPGWTATPGVDEALPVLFVIAGVMLLITCIGPLLVAWWSCCWGCCCGNVEVAPVEGASVDGFYGHPGEDPDLNTYRRLSRAASAAATAAAEADAALDYAESGYGGRRESADLTRMTKLRTQAAQLAVAPPPAPTAGRRRRCRRRAGRRR